jgi:hypothetical protein
MAVFTVIDHTELTGTAASWNVTSIPSSYDHLLIMGSVRSDYAAVYYDVMGLRFNGDDGSNYTSTLVYAGDATPTSTRSGAATSGGPVYCVPAASSTADTFGPFTMWIPHYSNTANYKQVFAQGSNEGMTAVSYQWWMSMNAILWGSTAAIDEITISCQRNSWQYADFVEFSSFTLYGVTGA